MIAIKMIEERNGGRESRHHKHKHKDHKKEKKKHKHRSRSRSAERKDRKRHRSRSKDKEDTEVRNEKKKKYFYSSSNIKMPLILLKTILRLAWDFFTFSSNAQTCSCGFIFHQSVFVYCLSRLWIYTKFPGSSTLIWLKVF